MKTINVGAPRSANYHTRSASLLAANDLVQRTLAQHGLVPNPGHGKGNTIPTNLRTMDALLTGYKLRLGAVQSPDVALPSGAKLRQENYSCQAGRRDYRIYIPSTATKGATGIVVMLHGCTQTPEDFAIGTGMNGLAEEHRFIVIYPAQSRGDNAQSCWNWFSRGDQRRDKGEPAILAGITRKVAIEHGIDKDQTFVAGLSAGAAMAVILGETYPDVFAAVGAHSGLPFASAKDVPSAFAAMAGNTLQAPSGAQVGPAVRTIVFHGTADTTVHPSNSDNIARRAMDLSARQTIETIKEGHTSGRRFTRRITATVDGTLSLEHWTIDGLGHAWSGGRPGGSYADQKGPDASAEMIRFFFDNTDEVF